MRDTSSLRIRATVDVISEKNERITFPVQGQAFQEHVQLRVAAVEVAYGEDASLRIHDRTPCVIASVSPSAPGRVKAKTLPPSGLSSTHILPPWARTI